MQEIFGEYNLVAQKRKCLDGTVSSSVLQKRSSLLKSSDDDKSNTSKSSRSSSLESYEVINLDELPETSSASARRNKVTEHNVL